MPTIAASTGQSFMPDAIRAELTARGVAVEDTAHGPRWSVVA